MPKSSHSLQPPGFKNITYEHFPLLIQDTPTFTSPKALPPIWVCTDGHLQSFSIKDLNNMLSFLAFFGARLLLHFHNCDMNHFNLLKLCHDLNFPPHKHTPNKALACLSEQPIYNKYYYYELHCMCRSGLFLFKKVQFKVMDGDIHSFN